LTGADLSDANLAKANLERAVLTDANLRRVKLDGAVCSQDTQWPRGFVVPAVVRVQHERVPLPRDPVIKKAAAPNLHGHALAL
jgi:Pentapeptide repeats (8 copies)